MFLANTNNSNYDWHTLHPNNPLQWRHNESYGISNHQRLDCLLNCLFRRNWKIAKLRAAGLCEGDSSVTGEFPAQRPVARNMFPFDDVIIHAYGSHLVLVCCGLGLAFYIHILQGCENDIRTSILFYILRCSWSTIRMWVNALLCASL